MCNAMTSFTTDSHLSGVYFNIWSSWSSSDFIHFFSFKNAVPNKTSIPFYWQCYQAQTDLWKLKHRQQWALVDIQLVE